MLKNKSPEALAAQYQAVQTTLGGESPLPDTASVDRFIGMSAEELENNFPLRYELYVELLRNIKAGENADVERIDKIKKIFKALNCLDKYIVDHEAAQTRERTLRPRQFSVFQDIRDFLEDGLTEGYIKLPTGVGKTVIFVELAEATGLKTLVVAPTNVIVEQTEKRFKEFAPELDVGVINKNGKKIGKNVTITTYNSFISQFKKKNGLLDFSDIELLVLDEAHLILGPGTSAVLQDPILDHMIKIGFTATPKYSERRQVENLLKHLISSMNIQEAVREGLLCGFKVILVKTKTSLRGIKITSTGEYSEEELDKAINTEARNQAAVELYKRAFNGQKIVLNCNSVNHAKSVAEAFKKAGIPVEAVSGEQTATKQGSDEQDEIFAKFDNNEIVGLANARLLIAGWDNPSVKVCFNLAPTQSIVNAEQRGGRVLRLFGESIATVVDFIDEADEANFPVTFVEIANTSAIPPIDQPGDNLDRPTATVGEDPLESLNIEGLTITIDPDEVLRMVKEGIEGKKMVSPVESERSSIYPPDGWLNIMDLSRILNKDPGTIRSWPIREWIDKEELFKKNFPQDLENDLEIETTEPPKAYGKYIDITTGTRKMFYDPDIVPIIKKYSELLDLSIKPRPPEGWLSFEEIAKKHNLNMGKVIYASKFLRDILPNDIGQYAINIRYPKVYMSPQYVEGILEKIKLGNPVVKVEMTEQEIEEKREQHEKNIIEIRELLKSRFNFSDGEIINILKTIDEKLKNKLVANYIMTEDKEGLVLYIKLDYPDNFYSHKKTITVRSAKGGKSLDKVGYNLALSEYEALSKEEKKQRKAPSYSDFLKETKIGQVTDK